MSFRIKNIALAALCCALPTAAWADLAACDAINLNISNDTGYQMSGDGTTVTLAGEMPDNAWQNTPTGNAVHSEDARNGRITGVTAYSASTQAATTLSDVIFNWAVEADGVANYGSYDWPDNPTFHKAWLARANKGAEASAILVQNIPYQKYDVIVYCFGSNTLDANTPFTPVFVNGVAYVGDATSEVATKTVLATSTTQAWGTLQKDPELGKTAVKVTGLSAGELAITMSCGAYGICAVQIVRDMDYGDEGPYLTTKKVISLNLQSNKSSAGATLDCYGLECVPSGAWTSDGLALADNGANYNSDVAVEIKQWDGTATTTLSGVTLHENVANAYSWCSAYILQSQFLSGYADDMGTHEITLSNVPYPMYDVIVYCATDNANKQFGPITVNGTPYRWDDDSQAAVVTSSSSSTAETRWGATQTRVPSLGRNAIRITNQYGSTLTVAGADNANNARGGIAAIQIVAVNSGTAIYENGAWTVEPTAGNDAIIIVNGDTQLAYSGTTEKLGTVSIVGSGTLTVSGATISATSLDVESLVSVTMNSCIAADTVTGSGTVVYDGAIPPSGKGWDDSAWSGTVWIKNKSGITGNNSASTGVQPNSLGNINSKVKFSGVSGWLEAPIEYNPEIVLENDSYDYALKLTNGNSPSSTDVNKATTIKKLSGSGKLCCGGTSYAVPALKVYDSSEYTGSVDTTNSDNSQRTGLVVVFCDADTVLPDTLVNMFINSDLTRTIYVASGKEVTVGSAAIWTAVTGIQVYGTVKAARRSNWGDSTAMTLGDTGVLELVTGSNYVNDKDTNYSKVTGTGTVRYTGTNWRSLPDGSNMFATTLSIELENDTGVVFNGGSAVGSTGTIGGLFGTKNLRTDLGGSGKVLTVKQAKDGVWSGIISDGDRLDTLIVDPGASTTGTLTLAGSHTSVNNLTVNGSVNLTGTWVGATTVNGTIGGTGTLSGNLTFGAGSTFKAYATDDADGLAVSGTVTYPDEGTVTADVSGLDLEGVYYIPLLSGAGLAPEDTSKFELANAIPFHFVFNGDKIGLERDSDYPDLYEDYVTLTLNNIGMTPIANYTLLVRISKALLPGFSYERAGDPSTIAFTDGHGAPLSYEIDTWNTKGESLVWVKVPKAADGNKIIFYWSLKEGKSAPENVPGDVWSDYAGVWHMNDATDSTTNKTSGTVGEIASPQAGEFGNALGATAQGSALLTATQNSAINSLTGGVFTVSMWVNLNSVSGGPYLFSRETEAGVPGYGWRMCPGYSDKVEVYFGGGSGNRYSRYLSSSVPIGEWAKLDVVYGGNYTEAWLDGERVLSVTGITVPTLNGDGDLAIGGLLGAQASGTVDGAIDEFRIRAGGVEAARLVAEMANANFTDYKGAVEGDGVSFLVPSTVVSDGKEYDYWLSWPTISPKYWSDDAQPAVIYVEGVLRSGAAVTNWCENLLTHDIIYDVSPENLCNLPVGSYRMYCARKDTENVIIKGEKVPWVDFTIAKDSGTKSVGDTASGRILLMNNDFSQGGDAASPSIGSQGYSDTNATDSVFWEFPDGFDAITSTLNPMPGTNSILWSVSDDKSVTNKLWHLVACRHGNTYPSDGAPLNASQNYLPWSAASSCSITNGAVAAKSGADAGQILMLNTTEACVYSPCYANGIGTIYFDAVNGWTNNPAAYQLIVEYATNTLTGASIADENLWQKDELGVVTNWYGNLEDKDIGSSCWHPCKVNVAQVTGGNDIDHISEVSGPFTLAVASDSPTTGEFYRVYAPLDIRNPVRFRIRRVSTDGEQGIDAAYLLLDNIIVSYPAMGATLSPTGWYDPEKKGLSVLGFESAFTKPFPVAGDDTIYGRAHAEYYVNSATALDETNFVASAKMHYRWRYLSRKVSEWNSVELDPENDFLSVDHLILPDEIGDVEFWYEYVLQVPYYSYVDYTGLPDLQSAFTAKYTEAKLGPQTNRADVVLNDYPTGGTDWFVRLRRNSSDYEAFKIHFKTNANDTVSTVDMSLVGKGTWRGFVPTQIALADGLLYRIEGRNPQTGEEWQWSTNYLSAISTGIEPVVASIYMSGASDTNNWDWAAVECDAATGYLMFQLDERTLSLTITHADYQNINKWHDAHDPDGSFVGSSIEDEDAKKSGTSSKTSDFSEDYDAWPNWRVTMTNLWEEAFEFPGVTTATSFGGKNMYEPFDSVETLNGWKSGPGMWVYSRHYNPNYEDHWALQMKGNGAGYMMFTGDEADTPYGIGSVSFKARLAQQISLDTMSYDDAASRGLTNYTFFSFASLSDGSTDNFDGDASVSVLAYYTPQKGCYEFRVTQNTDSSLMLSIYRWTKPGAPTGKATLLAQQKFDHLHDIMKMKVSGTSVTYGGLFISCSNAVDHTGITAGILRYPHDVISGTRSGELCPGNQQLNKGTSCSWIGLVCKDDDDDSRLTAGRYGVTSKNCPAIFWNPRHCEKEVTLPFTPGGSVADGEASFKNYYDGSQAASGGNNSFRIDAAGADPRADAVDSLKADSWAIDKSRFAITNMESTVNWGLAAKTIPQKVAVEWAPAGKSTGFAGIATNDVVTYAMKNYTVPVYLRNNASVRLQMVGSDDDARADVVIDNVSFTQFRGGTMGGRDADYVPDDNFGYRTNFYFSSCWMTNGMAKMSARRTLTNDVCAIRSPLMDGIDGRGIGLGMFSFEYKNAQTNTTLILQIATNITTLSVTDYNKPTNSSLWQDVTNFTFTADTEDLAHGTRSCYLGLHGVKGMMRLIVDPAKVDEVASYTDPTAFGEIDIESVLCRDEPVLDERSWWGWNIRTLNSDGSSVYDDGSRTILQDYGTGLSLAINNSVSEDTKRINGDPDPSFTSYMPFVQTPTFTSNIVGEVSFVARRFDNEDEAQFAEVTLYGAKDGNASDWEILRHFTVSNTIYETYTYQIQNKSGYSAFRLAVTGVYGIDDSEARGLDPEYGEKPVRVMIDEIAVFEAVWPSMGFRYVYPFRTKLDETGKHEGVVDSSYNALMDEQPLAGERWTVQAEIFAKMLPDELDLTTPGHEPKVLFYWYPSADTWGFKNWKRYATPFELALADGETMVFRGSVPNTPDAIVPNSDPNNISRYQYMAEVVYWTVNGNVLTNEIDRSEWVTPSWYGGRDLNEMATDNSFSPFTILDTIAPKRVWFNEVNIYDGRSGSKRFAETNQYVEVAVPQNQAIKGWKIEYISSANSTTNTLCTFGSSGVSYEKSGPATNGYVFITVQCPKGELTGYQADGKWSYNGTLEDGLPIALRLVRKSGVVEQEIALEGTNTWAGSDYASKYSVESFVEKLNSASGHYYYDVGNEYGGGIGDSLGVTNGIGAVKADWMSPMRKTPGEANVGQMIPEDYVIIPNSRLLQVTSQIGALGFGHIRQTFGTLVDSTADTKVMTAKGEDGTNIVYTIDKWWEIASLTTNNVEVALTQEERKGSDNGTYKLTVGAGASNDISVVVSAQPLKTLRDCGITEDNKYADAVMAWLAGGVTQRGAFAGAGDSIEDAYFKGIYSDSVITNLTLTDRYWLDIDPTEPGWVLRGGIVSAPEPTNAYEKANAPGEPNYDMVSSMKITIKMMITNECDVGECASAGKAYAPYVLRGLAPSSQSTDMLPGNWTSVTFKVTGDIQNGNVLRTRWLPLRRFVFAGDGAGHSTSFDSDFTSVIEIYDPRSPKSGTTYEIWRTYPYSPIFYSWAIDDRGAPDTPVKLLPDSTFNTITP